jgi:hypothetical protein
MKLRRSTIPKALGFAWLLTLFLSASVTARKFYDDDPLEQEPPPMNANKVAPRRISDAYDLFSNTLSKRGERATLNNPIPARAINTLGEVPDNSWYTNRHYKQRLSIEELVRGPGDQNAPDTSGPLTVVSAKTEGVTPGFLMEDARGRLYNVKFDPLKNPEMATSADVIVSKFFYALGYNVPENYIFTFSRSQLRIAPTAQVKTKVGKRRPMTERDLTEIFLKAPKLPDGRYRSVASFYLKGKNVGEFRYFGTRSDDPNDIVPHEHRRDLRGLRVFCAWLGHDDSRAINTLDMLVEENGVQFIKHHLIDFGATLGSDSYRPNSPDSGNVYWFAWDSAAAQFFSLGLDVPRWMRAHYPKVPAVGRFEAKVFDPEKWVPFYPCPAFDNCLPDDAFWAAKQVMAFSDEEIRALVKTGQYTDRRAEEWIVQCLIQRRDKTGKAYFAKVLPVDRFAVRDDRLAFDDLAVEHKLAGPRHHAVQWSRFNNDTEQKTPLAGEAGLSLPRSIEQAAEGAYFAADISAGDKQKTVTVYLRKKRGQIQVVGVDRTW